MEKSWRKYFFLCYHFEEIAKIIWFQKKISSLFQYSERTIASTDTNDTSTERSDTQLFVAGKCEGVALSGGLHAHLPPKDIEKKVNLLEPSQDSFFFSFNCTNFILISWAKCKAIDFELQQGLSWVLTNCHTYPTPLPSAVFYYYPLANLANFWPLPP